MNTKNLLVSFIALATVLALVSTVSAFVVSENDIEVWVDGVSVDNSITSTIYAGESLSVKVRFPVNADTEDLEVEAEIEGYGDNIDNKVFVGTILMGKFVSKTLRLDVPFDSSDLGDELTEEATLVITITSDDGKVEKSLPILVQRESFKVDVMSISTTQTVEAGQMLPVDVVVKNRGFENLDDLYVTAKITSLGLERTAYFGDLVAFECDDDTDWELTTDRDCNEDDMDTTSGRIYLQIPESVKSGVYTVEVTVSGEDTETTATKQVSVENSFDGNTVIASTTSKTVAVGEDATYNILIVNPTSTLKVYRVVPEASGDLSVNAGETVVAVPAGSSKTVTVTANAAAEGTYNFKVSVLSGETVVNTVALSTIAQGRTAVQSPIVVLTVVLAIVFVVLLIVLIVLLGRKPEKSEEFGESYY